MTDWTPPFPDDSFSIAAPDTVLVDSLAARMPPWHPELALLVMALLVLGAFAWSMATASEWWHDGVRR